jgi:hypothetical protein
VRSPLFPQGKGFLHHIFFAVRPSALNSFPPSAGVDACSWGSEISRIVLEETRSPISQVQSARSLRTVTSDKWRVTGNAVRSPGSVVRGPKGQETAHLRKMPTQSQCPRRDLKVGGTKARAPVRRSRLAGLGLRSREQEVRSWVSGARS